MISNEAIRLLNILKTNEELKKKIEELKFGCILDIEDECKADGIYAYVCEPKYAYYDGDLIVLDKRNYKIIGQATFIDLMYFLGSDYLIGGYGSIFKFGDDGEIEHQGINVHNIKELLDQDETVLKQLNDWLCKEFNINL